MNGINLYDGITLHQGDCMDIMRTYPDQHFDAVITDPPYGISFAGEKWDTATPTGFQSWAQSWGEEALRVIKPGGYMLAFSATRTYHRLTSGLEDAGFEIRDTMAWIRADGKPAGMDLSSAFDRDAGVLAQRVGRVVDRWDTSNAATRISKYKTNATGEPVTDEAKTWEGWGVGLKPAWEPIVVARRPLECRLVDNVRAHGTGAMNIRAGMDKINGLYPPNLLMGEQALSAAVEQGAPDHVWPVFRYQPKAQTSERPIVGGGTTRHREAARAHAVSDPSGCAARFADPRTVRRFGHDPAGSGHGERAGGRVRIAQPSGNSPTEHLRKKPGRDRVTDLAIIVENNLLPTGGLLPTPQATYAPRSSPGYGPNLHEAVAATDATFGPYAPAIARWEQVTGRQAPPPTTPPRRAGGKPQLSARFVEWMMGLPEGHVTGPDLDLSREQQLRMLGNGVVPQQAALAVHTLIHTAKEAEHAHV